MKYKVTIIVDDDESPTNIDELRDYVYVLVTDSLYVGRDDIKVKPLTEATDPEKSDYHR